MPVPKGASLDPGRTRAGLLDAAARIFYERGLDGVGIAELCASAGTSKETLYRHFGSKDGLIEAVLRARSDRNVHRLRTAAEAAGDDPAARLTAVFRALGDWYSEPHFRGCAIMNAASQRHTSPVEELAQENLSQYQQLLAEIATAAGVPDPEQVGRRLLILLEGSIVLADHQQDGRQTAEDALAVALLLLK